MVFPLGRLWTTSKCRPRSAEVKARPSYDRGVDRAVHDRGGWPTEAPIDRSEHELADWEVLVDALAGVLGRRGVMNVDELRRGIESMPPDEYERASYYERWLFSIETNLTEKGVLAPGELDRRIER
jgi:Nitrile hydratase beta subunit